jgi:hypothetical protein
MYIRELATTHPKPGLAGSPLPARVARNPNIRKAVLVREHAPSRMSKLAQPLREAGAASSGAESSSRCGEKGCVFPADQGGAGICRQHRREQREPTLFSSLQVTGLLLDAAKLGLPNSKRDHERQEDRRRLEAIRQRFLEEIA